MYNNKELQNELVELDDKILSGMERMAQVVRILLWEQAKRHGLSPIQVQCLLHLNKQPVERCRVGALAKEFDLREATISQVVGTLEDKKLLRKKAGKQDRRVTTLSLTATGRRMADKLTDWQSPIREQLERVPRDTKANVMTFILNLIDSLHTAGVINAARMCLTCSNFRKNVRFGTSRPHHCELTGRYIDDWEVKLDCANHKP